MPSDMALFSTHTDLRELPKTAARHRRSRNVAAVVVFVIVVIAAVTAVVTTHRKTDVRVGFWLETSYLGGYPSLIRTSVAEHGAHKGEYVVLLRGLSGGGSVTTTGQLRNGKIIVSTGSGSLWLWTEGENRLAAAQTPVSTGNSFYVRLSGQTAAVAQAALTVGYAVDAYAVDHDDTFPPASLVRKGGLTDYDGHPEIAVWPSNPFTGEPMRAGTRPGDFEYTLNDATGSFVLRGVASDGSLFSLPASQ
jgi:hypothetical protein